MIRIAAFITKNIHSGGTVTIERLANKWDEFDEQTPIGDVAKQFAAGLGLLSDNIGIFYTPDGDEGNAHAIDDSVVTAKDFVDKHGVIIIIIIHL